jgi:hypothetical protein
MCSTPVLELLDFTKTFVLECDASRKGIETILMQDGRSLAFTRKQLSERHLGQSIDEKEMLAILHAVDLWHVGHSVINVFSLMSNNITICRVHVK